MGNWTNELDRSLSPDGRHPSVGLMDVGTANLTSLVTGSDALKVELGRWTRATRTIVESIASHLKC